MPSSVRVRATQRNEQWVASVTFIDFQGAETKLHLRLLEAADLIAGLGNVFGSLHAEDD